MWLLFFYLFVILKLTIDFKDVIVYNLIKGGDNNMKTVEEVAIALKVSPSTIRRWVNNNKIKALKQGRIIRIPEEELERLKRGE